MLVAEIRRPVTSLRGAGPAMAARLERLGIRTVGDLLLLMPRGYEDRTTVVPLAQAHLAAKAAVLVEVVARTQVGWGRGRVPKVTVRDATAEASLLCFGRAFLGKVLAEGRRFYAWGSFRLHRGALECADFELEPWSPAPVGFGRILPVYPLTEGLTQAALRRLVRQALDEEVAGVEGELPLQVARERGYPPRAVALAGVHFPASLPEAEACRTALAFEELFTFEALVLRRRRALAVARPRARVVDPSLRDRLLARLPFALTADQETALAEIAEDLGSAVPMARLLQGEVGCGKTLVALLAALLVISGAGEKGASGAGEKGASGAGEKGASGAGEKGASGAEEKGASGAEEKGASGAEQVAFVAPTELLARQHAENAARLLEPLGVRIAFLSGSVTAEARGLLLAALAGGEVDIVFATHALFSPDVSFRRLGLVIVDEQHRFGVLQRSAVMRKGEAPDLLLMTATPIPRTLALTAFGDLDVSTIRTMPRGRRPVVTHLARQGNEAKVYRRVREELDKGRQAYFVYPLIGGSAAHAVKDAETAFRALKEKIYPDLEVALIHSRLPEEEKLAAMAGFVSGRVRVLVATSVVEVGVDVANAACMVVEHAERFGLSTLHQLRGRVGRGPGQSYAFLVYGGDLTPEGVERLKIMMETTDGFRIAERDLELRGPGELLGVRQSGFLAFRVADLARHAWLLVEARDAARRVLAEDPGLIAPGNAAAARALALAASTPWAGGGEVLEGG